MGQIIMRTKYLFVQGIFFISLCVLSLSGCHMLNLFDLDPDSPEVTRQYEMESDLREKYYEDLLIGKTKNEVLELLGKPETIFKEKKDFTIHPGKTITYHEDWWYEFKSKGVYGYSWYTVRVFFNNDIVIYASSG